MSWKSLSRLLSGIRGAYNDINPSTLTGAIDVIVVEQPDGSFTSGPFHVRFGKLTALSPADKVVEVYVNGTCVDFIQMRLGSAGDAYFVDINDEDSISVDERNELSPDPRSSDLFSSLLRSGAGRRRRRRARRVTVSSEPDPSVCEFDQLDDQRPLSDCEYSSPQKMVSHCSSDSVLSDDFTVNDKIDWNWDHFPRQLSERRATHTYINKAEPSSDKSDHISQQSQQPDGVYLEDLVSEADPAVKETYIYPPLHTSMGQSSSPNNRLPNENAAQFIDAGYRSDGEHSPRSLSPIYPNISGLRLSLCGCPALGSPLSDEKFFQHLVSFEEFIEDPEVILSNPNLTIYLNGKYLNWQVAAPAILSILAFQTELPHRTIRRLEDIHMRKKEARRSSWFSWGVRVAEPSNESRSAAVRSLEQVSEIPQGSQLEEANETVVASDLPEAHITKEGIHKAKKCNRLSSEEIARLRLKPGRNDVEFRITTKYQGTCICSASIFVWHWSDRIVVSDVDGTITRSDVLGHLLPMLGQDWTHAGVTRLYDRISRNGYRVVYLSARALGQAGITRSYLRQLVQDNISLPEGPILLSPSSLLHAFHQEVIEKKPEIFKIRCLADVCSLFPSNLSPFYAGFGNKANDVQAYVNAGIQRCRIFTINTRGEVRNEFLAHKVTSYTELSQLVDHYFPVLETASKVPSITKDEDRDLESTDSELTLAATDFGSNLAQPIHHTSPVDLSRYSSFTFWRDETHENHLPPVLENP